MARTYFKESDIDESKGNPWSHVSPSQINTSRTCLTKWFLSRRCPRSSSPATDLGTAVHAINEAHMLRRGGEWEDKALRIAKAMQPHLPAPGIPEENVETGIRYTPEGWPVPIVGFIDCVETPGTLMADGRTIGEEGRITDEKTTSSWRYMKTSEELAEDPQGILYAAWALSDEGPYSNQGSVEFRHVTAITKGAKVGTDKGVRTVSCTFDRDEVQEKLSQMLPEVVLLKELSVLRWDEDADKIPHDNESCFKYGRCEFWDICKAKGKTPRSKRDKEIEFAAGLDDLVATFENSNSSSN